MHIAFADESYSENFYFMGGVIVTTTQLKAIEISLSKLIENIRAERSLDTSINIEIHGSDLFSGFKDWYFLRNEPRLRNWVAFKVLEIAIENGAKFVIQGIDSSRLRERYSEPLPPHVLTHKYLLERIDEALEILESYALVINDNRTNQTEHNYYRNNFHSLIKKGSDGNFPRKINHLVDTLYFVDSKHSRGIQLADLVTYVYRRRFVGATLIKPKEDGIENCWNLISKNILREKIWSP
jgi:Protein of unknown function (DUF3800)